MIGASAVGINDLSHIHNIRVVGDKILFGTHEGFFQYLSKDKVISLSPDNFDVMGLTVYGETIYASGHPGAKSKLPQPVGLVKSSNLGKDWEKISLQGEVDFHLLESSKSELYGGDSSSGNLFYSSNSGKTWATKGKNTFSDIAPNPKQKGSAIGIRSQQLIVSSDAFNSLKMIKSKKLFSGIEWNSERLIATSGKELLSSKNLGKTWQTLFKFDKDIAVLAQSPALIVVVVGNSILVSADDGKTFQEK